MDNWKQHLPHKVYVMLQDHTVYSTFLEEEHAWTEQDRLRKEFPQFSWQVVGSTLRLP